MKRRDKVRILNLIFTVLFIVFLSCKKKVEEIQPEPPLPSPLLLIPQEGDTLKDSFPKFKWQKIENSVSYQIQIDNNPDISSPLITKEVNTDSFTPSISLQPGVYYWWVRGKSSSGVWGNFSDVWNFVIMKSQILPPPALIYPSNNDTLSSSNFTFDWNDVQGAVGYEIQVDTSPDFSSPIIKEYPVSSSYTPQITFSDGEYSWRVRAKDQNNKWGAWSSVWRFFIESGGGGGGGDFQLVKRNTILYSADYEIVYADVYSNYIFATGYYDFGPNVGNGFLIVFDLSDPLNPQIVSEITVNDVGFQEFKISGNYLYDLTTGTDTFCVIFDISSPSSPSIAGIVYNPYPDSSIWVKGIGVYQNYLYITAGTDGLYVFDVTDPASPNLVYESGFLNKSLKKVRIDQNYMYVAVSSYADDEVIRVYDISDPTNPSLVGYYYDSGINPEYIDICPEQNYLVTGGWIPGGPENLKVAFIDISNPSSLSLISYVDSFNVGFIKCDSFYSFLSGYEFYSDGSSDDVTNVYKIQNSIPQRLTSVSLDSRSTTFYQSYVYIFDNGTNTIEIFERVY